MRVHLVVTGCIVAGWVQCAAGQAPSTSLEAAGLREVSGEVRARVVQAIEDEVYDYGREGLFFEVDGNPGGDHTPAVLSVYVSKSLSPTGVGVAVYDDMPFGQIYRYFSVDQKGVVRLSGDPEGPFRHWGGSVLTVYMKMEEVCGFLTTQSVKGTFVVDPDVSLERRRAASARQLDRTGYSFWLEHKAHRPRKPHGPIVK